MKPFLRHQLERYAQRLEELDFLLSREDIMADMNQFLKLSREHAEVSALAKRYARYLERSSDLEAAHAMLETSSEDIDMQAMAHEEIQSASLEMSDLEAELQRMLLPKDPDDARPAFLEIRAGTGGDESALFAGDLLRMYTKFCERKGWRAEIMSESASELGGYKRWSFASKVTTCLARCALNRVATVSNACRPPKHKAVFTPAHAPWPFSQSPTKPKL
jgi:peptide chain release factor 1